MEAIKPYIKKRRWLWSVIIISFTVMSLIVILSLCCCLRIDETMLFWLFSATAQSMAALFAVIGMFAVFRHEYLGGVVRNNIDVLKANFKTKEWREFFNLEENPDCWEASTVVSKIKELLEKKKERSPHLYYNNAEVSNLVLESNQEVLKFLPIYTRVPMILVLITFLISIISIPFTSMLAVNIAGLIILMVLLPCIILSLFTIYRYFEITLLTR
jgi:hypothetical protein